MTPLGEHAGHLLPPRHRRGILGAADAVAAVAEQAPRAARGDQPVAGDREAAVLEQHERAGCAAALAQRAQHRDAVHVLRGAGVALLAAPRVGR